MDKRLLAEARKARRAFLLTVGLSVGVAILTVAQAFAFSRAINHVFLEKARLADVAGLLVLLALVIALRALASRKSGLAAADMAITLKADLRRRLMAHLAQLGPAYTVGQQSGELVITATEGVEALDAYFRDYLPGLFTALLIPLTILLFVFPLDLLTFIVLLLTAPLIPLMMALIGGAAGALARRQFVAMRRLGAHFLDVMQGLTTLKLFNRSRHQIATIGRITDQFREATLSVLRVAFLSAFMLEMLATLSVAIVAVEIGIRLLNGGIGFEQALFLLVIAPEFYMPLRNLGARFHAGTAGAAAAARIFDVLEQIPETAPETSHPASLPTTMLSSMHLHFEGVSYVYARGVAPALDGVTFEIRPGERVALVGPSGSGKSTILALLLRFITAREGKITVGGIDLNRLDAEQWRTHIAWVAQRPYLFNVTIAENIRLGAPGATMAQVVNAAQAAAAHDFIAQLPQGYETLCGERGLRLSSGQAQRIALARAFLHAAPLVLLDEATANLDAETEEAIGRALDRLMQGRTVLMVAHRLSTVIGADRIIVLQTGRVVEQGTHAALLAQGGVYHKMVEAYL